MISGSGWRMIRSFQQLPRADLHWCYFFSGAPRVATSGTLPRAHILQQTAVPGPTIGGTSAWVYDRTDFAILRV